MGYTSDSFTTKSALSREFREAVRGMAADLVEIMRYKPILDAMAQDIAGSGGGGVGGFPFPAVITGDGIGKGEPEGNSYTFEEIKDAHLPQIKAGGRQGEAFNVWETSAILQPDFIAPGAGCFGSLFPATSTLEVRTERIQYPTIVLIYPTLIQKETPGWDTGGYNYMFQCPQPLCVYCDPTEEPPGQGQQQANAYSDLASSRDTPRFSVIRNRSKSDKKQPRGKRKMGGGSEECPEPWHADHDQYN